VQLGWSCTRSFIAESDKVALMQCIIISDANRAQAVAQAAEALRAGKLVAVPTETVYGLAADAANGEAVARIFEAKGRPRFNPLICHVTDIAMAALYGVVDGRALALAEKFWPGPLTIVLPLAPGAPVHPLVTAGLHSIALRAPLAPARDIIEALGGAIAAPSANRSGRISPTRAEHVIGQFGEEHGRKIALVLDAGPSSVGLESTVVALTGSDPKLLRPGGIPTEAIETILGATLERANVGDAVTAPGMLASHYAPNLPVRLEAFSVRPGEALLAFGGAPVPGAEHAAAVRNLSPSGNLVEAAVNLFAYLAELDGSGASGIAVTPIPTNGLGEAINDRLTRAARAR
jgi:L-threonylcarbamoyladenylate synthase